MSKKMMLLAAALTALAFAALPAMASAGEPQTHCPEGKATCEFTVSGPTGELWTTENSGVHCTSTTGSGTMGTTTGTMTLTFHGCTETTFGSSCTSGKTSGTIETTALTYHNIYASDNKTSPAVLVTPNATTGIFAHFTCFGGLVTKTISGSGVIGTLTSPKCGEESNKYSFSFTQTGNGHQAHKQITGTGAVIDLSDGGVTASMLASGTIEIVGGGKASLTCV